MILRLTLLAAFVWTAACGPVGNAPPPDPAPIAQFRGGSNFNFWRTDPGCVRDPYAVLRNYDTAKAEIDDQLRQMYAEGQRSLRIMLFFWDGYQFINGLRTKYTGPLGAIVDSTGGAFQPQIQANLKNLLAAIKATGYERVEIAFGPQGANNIESWPTWQEDYFQQQWALIQSVRPMLVASGLPYMIDLSNEQSPDKYWPEYKTQLIYTQRLWILYSTTYGTADTVGFSMIGQPAAIADDLTTIYGSVWPPTLDIHFYDAAGAEFKAMVAAMKGSPHQPSWIIGESYYNDPTEAEGLRQAIVETGQKVLYLTQWPVQTGTMDCVPTPLVFTKYQAAGF